MTTITAPARDTLPTAGTWEIDPAHTSVEGTVRHLMVSKVRARFTSFSGTVQVADDITDSTVEVSIDARSIDTSNGDRDQHLRSPDFLDVENHPTITFRSNAVQHVEGDRYQVPGTLTIRGVTKPVTLDVSYFGLQTDPYGNTKAGFEATAEFDRDDFDVNWNLSLIHI